ncbi:hypothetical protein C8N46_104114 [Kordia periserrulae]|uniref:Uncharacterized protein n=1 Tax=Kordia periserrulae TaxID=701523 RepID=A0A2T6BZH3_9FLAO|nr:hypothetical protein [Kordia periserrulae]PTX61471.1 hypothetical protein C8N46_104114 [Kordia periserrulae]
MEKENAFNEEEIKLRVLLIIEKNGSIDDLYNAGFKYFQITKFLKEEISNNNAEFVDDKLVITKKGIKEKQRLIELLKIEKLEKFVMPQLSSKKIDLINLNDVFIPSEDELTF